MEATLLVSAHVIMDILIGLKDGEKPRAYRVVAYPLPDDVEFVRMEPGRSPDTIAIVLRSGHWADDQVGPDGVVLSPVLSSGELPTTKGQPMNEDAEQHRNWLLTWRYGDGSASGVVPLVFTDDDRAMIEIVLRDLEPGISFKFFEVVSPRVSKEWKPDIELSLRTAEGNNDD